MFRLVIADDERLIIKGLEKILDWHSLNIEIVGEYMDGKSALEGIIALSPDIALLDISMPALSGIDVLKTLQEQNIGTSVIFISGFQDFEYVKAAIRHGAKDYLLKPVVRAELLRAIEKCLPEKREKKEEGIKREGYKELLKAEDGFYLSSILINAGEESPLSRLLKFSIKEEIKEKVSKDGSIIYEEDKDGIFIMLPYSSKEKALSYLKGLKDGLNNGNSNYVSFILSHPLFSVAAIKGEKEICSLFSDFSFFSSYLGECTLALSDIDDQISPLTLMEMREALFQALISHNEDEFNNRLIEFSTLAPKYSSYKKSEAAFFLCNIYRTVYDRLRAAMINLPDADIRALMDSLLQSQSYSAMVDLFLKEANGLFDIVIERTGGGAEKEFVIALDYIEKHYNEPIGLKTIADVVKMNAYYFSSYFKKNTGVNFKDYLRKVRMSHAMELIVSTELSLTQIAKEVGLMDIRTFSDLFYKTYGEKPRECARRIRGGDVSDEG